MAAAVGEQAREDALAQPIGAFERLAAVREDVALTRVAVQVAEEEQLIGAREALHQPLEREDGRHVLLVRVRPLAVEVDADSRAAVVAEDDAVGVEHRDDLEQQAAAQRARARRVGGDRVEQPVHHPARVGLAWVHSCRDDDHLRGDLRGRRGEVGHCEEVADVAAGRVAQQLALHDRRAALLE